MNYYNKDIRPQPEKDHQLKLNNRRLLEITGVKEVDSFDSEEFLLQTVMGYLIIRGHNLQLKNLDVSEGIVSIKGKVYEMAYVDEEHQEKAKGFFSKLFR
ncbi:sporulation protein YabP [Virgibacillus soli]|uniref:Sporulation protein YabP n=1 Tax=Paracerasibacillus soli TaxID=480284 RepID=A0ABU5CW05_9BACI|nr:sporulation protein YabP [Virgibacillus soli]MDY0410009.1 sporulation protein YabP [Virgibacillus soli]